MQYCGYPNFFFTTGAENFQKLFKRNANDDDLILQDINRLEYGIPEKKKKSLRHLLEQQFGPSWEEETTPEIM